MSNSKRKEVMDYLTRKPVTSNDFQAAIDISKLRSQTLPQAPSIEQPETDYQTEVQPNMVVPPQDVLPKGAEPVMPFAPGIPNPQDRILELAEGGRIELAGGGDPEKIARIKELIKEGKYNKTQIINILREEGYGRTRTGKDSLVNKVAEDLEINLPQGLSKEGFSAHEAKGKYLPFYDNQKLKIDLEKGKTLQDIGKELYQNNKKFYNNIGITENNISVLNNALSSKIRKNEDFINLHEINVNKNIKQQEQVLKDVDTFIKNNKNKYLNLYETNKIGAPDKFKNDLLNFIENKHPDFIKTTEIYNPKNPLPKGSRVLDLPDIYDRNINRAGDYGRDVFLKRKIRESLGISERPAKGEGLSYSRRARKYNITTEELLKQAQEAGTIPKINPFNKTPINNEAAYYRYAKQAAVDPIKKLFEGKVDFGVEHVGGIARAGKISDYETLDKVLAMDSYTNKFVKSSSFDNRVTNLMELAKQSETPKAKEYIETINDIATKAEKQYGIPLTKYKVVKDKIIAVHPDISLNDSTFKKSKIAINNFIVNDGLNHPNFEKFDPNLQKAIINYSKNKTKEADSLLKGVLKEKGLSAEIIPGIRSILDSKILTNLVEAGSPAVNTIIKNASSLSKTTGLPLNAALGAFFNFEEMEQKGLSPSKSAMYGAIKGFSEDLLNFGAQVVSAIPLMSQTLFNATIEAGKQPPQDIDSFDQVGGKQGTQSKFFNKLFNISPVDISEIPFIGSTWASEQQTTKQSIDSLVNMNTRKAMAKLYPAPQITDVDVSGTEIQQEEFKQQEENIKKYFYDQVFKNENLKNAYEQDLLKEKEKENVEVKPKGVYNVDIINPNIPQEFAEGGLSEKQEEDDLYIPPLSGPEKLKKDGVEGLYFGLTNESRQIPLDEKGNPITSGGIKELKQVLSSLLSDQKPEIGYGTDRFNISASKGINPFQGDRDIRYQATYTPEGDVGKFMIGKTPQALGAGYSYQNDGLDLGITGLKNQMGDKSIMLRFGYKYNNGGRVNLKNGTDDMYSQEIPSLGETDPIAILEQQIANEKDPKKILKLTSILERIKEKQAEKEKAAEEYKISQKEKGIKYKEDFPSEASYFAETGKQLLTNPKYFYGKLGKGVVEGTEWLAGQPLQILFNQEGKNFEFYQPKAGEKLGINKFIEENIPKGATTGTLALGETAEIAGQFLDPFLAYGIVKGIKPKSTISGVEETIDPMRRDILKTSAVMGTGAALYPIAKKINILEDLGKVVPKKAPLVKIIKPLGATETEFPNWFPSLVSRIRKEGEMTPIYRKEVIPITKEEYMEGIKKTEKVKGEKFYVNARTEEYFRENPNEFPYFKTKETEDIIGYEYTDKNLPNVKVIERDGKEMDVYFKNDYYQDVEVNYRPPGLTEKGEFTVRDYQPEVGSSLDSAPDMEEVIVKNMDEVFGGASSVEQYATKSKNPRYTKGDAIVDDANARAEAEYDRMKDEGLFDD